MESVLRVIGDNWLQTLGWVTGLGIVFGILERLTPCNPGMYWWRNLRGVATDVVYWFIVPLVLLVLRRVMLIAGIVLIFGGAEPDVLPVKELPIWVQCVLILLIQDVMLYWIHRAFHSRFAWRFHAIHHSTRVLGWMSASRFHPINNLLSFSLADVTVLLLGFSPDALVVLAPFNIVYSSLVHANLNWTYGPFRYLFASPVFHRWHHTVEAGDKNFASNFPFLDLLFGTYYMPTGQLPVEFGNGEPDFPESFWGQFLHPFRKAMTEKGRLLSATERTLRRARRRRTVGLSTAGIFVFIAVVGVRLYYLGKSVQAHPHVERHPVGPPAPGANEAARVWSVAVTADGQQVVTGNEDGTIGVWDATTGKAVMSLTGHTRPVPGIAFSGDGRVLVSASFDRTVRVWDATTKQERWTLHGHRGTVLSVAVSGDGKRVVSGGAEMAAKVWNAETGQEERTLTGQAGAVLGVAISGDGRRIVTASGTVVKTWDGNTGQLEHAFTGHADLIYCVAITPDGKHIISGGFDQKIKVWDAATGREERTLVGHTEAVYSVAVTPDGATVVSGSQDQTVALWDVATGKLKRNFVGHTGPVRSVAISSDGRRVASGSKDGTMKVWDAVEEVGEKQARR